MKEYVSKCWNVINLLKEHCHDCGYEIFYMTFLVCSIIMTTLLLIVCILTCLPDNYRFAKIPQDSLLQYYTIMKLPQDSLIKM